MMSSKVYFTDMRCKIGVNLQDKLAMLIKKAGIDTIDFDGKFAAIKIHFGEPGNLAFLRPNFAKTVADAVKQRGGNPFLTDCNTLYPGRRKNALEHIDAAYENGFSPFSTGCNVIIADGLKGTDDVAIPTEGNEYCPAPKIGRAIADADVFISLAHFKGHEATGFGGALKNIGMGCGSRAGKMEMHCGGKPEINPDACRGCHQCAKQCANNGIEFIGGKAHINNDNCVGCGRCIGACNFDAIYNPNDSTNDELNCKMAEYAKAAVNGRPAIYINIVNQVSPCCDCHAENDAAIIPDVGMFASLDPVALDNACADACNAMPIISNSRLGEKPHTHGDHFTDSYPETNWRSCLEHAEKIGLGVQAYELITL
ncbi:MAG: DUF362 domain-containing protein [Clostridia bacterium]|nr:DUF362 domain-containing protein [Clostridia bacterium]NLS86196.1 DUF362 domain-containing protein [Oscillospiraceae bacterium]